jgi:FkbM family methyltransferase
VTVRHRARLLLQRAGLDVTRFPGDRPERSRVLLLQHHGVSLVVDVGANRGQYGAELRRFGYTGDIVSFEPLGVPWRALQQRAAGDPRWRTVQCALGATDGEVTINVAANAAASSSVLPMLETHVAAAPDARYVGQEQVPLRRLDEVLPTLTQLTDRAFLKVDVQGYERDVLTGAEGVLDRLVGVQLELSLVPLYEGAMDYREALDLMATRGFTLEGLERGFSDRHSGQLLQADGLFFRA